MTSPDTAMKVRRPHRYRLADDGRTAVPVEDLMEWACWVETASTTLALNSIGRYRIETSFLTVDFNLSHEGPPILWETVVFVDGGQSTEFGGGRYTNADEAMAGHLDAVGRVLVAARLAGEYTQ